jgi:hypothetical protein
MIADQPITTDTVVDQFTKYLIAIRDTVTVLECSTAHLILPHEATAALERLRALIKENLKDEH